MRKVLRQHDAATSATDWNIVSVTALADHILETHHIFMKEQLPRLDALLGKVQKAPRATHPQPRNAGCSGKSENTAYAGSPTKE